jgi:gliding motility-associated-like protein
MVWNFGLFSAGGEEDLGMLAFNTMNQSSLAGRGSPDLKFATSSGFTLNEGYPRPRLFTPNGDGENDKVTFSYENDNESSVVCWIFDIRGAAIRQLDIVETGENKFTWDGKDENKEVAPSGIYIYQIEVEGKTINGTIVLAK